VTLADYSISSWPPHVPGLDPGIVAAIHDFGAASKDVDGWARPSHDVKKHQ
jgi:hypothetical protein